MRLMRGANKRERGKERGEGAHRLILNPVLCTRDDYDSANATHAPASRAVAFHGSVNSCGGIKIARPVRVGRYTRRATAAVVYLFIFFPLTAVYRTRVDGSYPDNFIYDRS